MTSTASRALGWVAFAFAASGACWVFGQNAGLRSPATLVGLASALPLYVAARGWRLPWWLGAGAATLPLSLVVVALAHGTVAGLGHAGRLAYGALLVLALAAWARSTLRRLAVVGVIGMIGVLELLAGLGGLWRGMNPGQFLTGNSWPNQFAFTCLAAAAAGLVVAAAGRWSLSMAGLGTTLAALGAVAGIAGVILSGSRSGLAGLAVAGTVALALAMLARRWIGLLRWALLAVAGVGLAVAVRLPLLLQGPAPASPAPSGGSSPEVVGALTRGTLDLSWVSRLDYWRVALELGVQHPIAGVGLGRYGDPGLCVERGYLASDPHNEWLRAFAEGGLIAVMPMLLLLVGILVLLVRSLPALRGRRIAADPARWGALLALLALVAHLAVDFDWRYAALIALAAMTAGAAAAPLVRLAPRSPASAICSAVLVAAIVAAGAAGFLLDPSAGSPLQAVVGTGC